mmetsp:Transcript_32524/g.94028  ORF Transcript_32524/g.94028 Transcript_32524/m.94028 type:complete len:343 (+) Transcript_32524:468-1496(+)
MVQRPHGADGSPAALDDDVPSCRPRLPRVTVSCCRQGTAGSTSAPLWCHDPPTLSSSTPCSRGCRDTLRSASATVQHDVAKSSQRCSLLIMGPSTAAATGADRRPPGEADAEADATLGCGCSVVRRRLCGSSSSSDSSSGTASTRHHVRCSREGRKPARMRSTCPRASTRTNDTLVTRLRRLGCGMSRRNVAVVAVSIVWKPTKVSSSAARVVEGPVQMKRNAHNGRTSISRCVRLGKSLNTLSSIKSSEYDARMPCNVGRLRAMISSCPLAKRPSILTHLRLLIDAAALLSLMWLITNGMHRAAHRSCVREWSGSWPATRAVKRLSSPVTSERMRWPAMTS